MLDLIEAVERRQAGLVRALGADASGEAVGLAADRLVDAVMDDASKDWYPTTQALIGTGKLDPITLTRLFAQGLRADCVGLVRACVEAGHPIEIDISEQNQPPWGSRSPLTIAANGEHVEVLRYLIEQGVDLHRYDSRGDFCLSSAISGDANEALQMLLEAGANPALQYRHQIPLLHHLLNTVNFNRVSVSGLDIANTLIRHGHSIEAGLFDAPHNQGPTIAEQMGKSAIMKDWVGPLAALEQAQKLTSTTGVPTGTKPGTRL